MVAAANALRMKSYSSMAGMPVMMPVPMRRVRVVAMIVAFQLVTARHHEDAALDPDDFDLRAVKAGQHRAGDDFVDGAERGLAAAEIKHAIDGAEQGIELMSAEQHGDPQLALQRFHQTDHF